MKTGEKSQIMSNEKNGYHCQCGKSFDFKSSYEIHVKMSKHDFQDKQNSGNVVQTSQKIGESKTSSPPVILTPPPSPPHPMVIENDIFRENEFTENCKNQEEIETIDLDDDIVIENGNGKKSGGEFQDPLSPASNTTSGSGEDIEIIEQIESNNASDISITKEVVNNDGDIEIFNEDDELFKKKTENLTNVEVNEVINEKIQQSKNPMQYDATKILPSPKSIEKSVNNSETPKITPATVEILDLEKNENIPTKVNKSDNDSSSNDSINENGKATNIPSNDISIHDAKNDSLGKNKIATSGDAKSSGSPTSGSDGQEKITKPTTTSNQELKTKKATTPAYKENSNYVRKRKKINFGMDDLKDGSDHIQRNSDSEEEAEFTKIDINSIIARSPRPKRNCNRNKKVSEDVVIDLIDDDDDDDFTEKSTVVEKENNEKQQQKEDINNISKNESKFPCMYKSCERKGKKFVSLKNVYMSKV